MSPKNHKNRVFLSILISHEIPYHLESSGPTGLIHIFVASHFVNRFSLEPKSITVCISLLYRNTKEPFLALEN